MASIREIVEAKAGEATERPKTNLRELLGNGGVVVVAGVRSTNIPPEMRNHPRLVFFDSQDAADRGRELPSNARAVIITRWVAHEQYVRLARQAKARGCVLIPGLQTTGDLRQQLAEIIRAAAPPRQQEEDFNVMPEHATVPATVVHSAAPAPAPDRPKAVEASGKMAKGTMRTFILKEGNPKAPPVEEGERLFALLKAQGLAATSTTLDSVRQAMRSYLGKAREAHEPKAAKVAEPHLAAPAAVTRHRDLVLDAVMEAERYVGDVKAAADLLAEILPKIRFEIERFREQREKLRAFLE